MTLDAVLQTLVSFWLFDVSVFTNPWLYVPMFIPILFYLIFFMCKWIVLTAPMWLPITIIVHMLQQRDTK